MCDRREIRLRFICFVVLIQRGSKFVARSHCACAHPSITPLLAATKLLCSAECRCEFYVGIIVAACVGHLLHIEHTAYAIVCGHK